MTPSLPAPRRPRARAPLRVVFVAYPDGLGLDLTGPYEVFARANRVLREEGRPHPGYRLEIAGTQPGPLTASSGFRFLPDAAYAALRGPIDTLLVTGGPGADRAAALPGLRRWLRRLAPRVRRLGSVCTGAFVLAEAGLLDGRRATTHWRRAAELSARYPKVQVDADAIYVRDGGLVTSAGVTAGMDLALALVEEDLGRDVALSVARALVVYLRRPGGQSQYSAPLRLQAAARPDLRDLVAWAADHPATDLSVEALARRAGMSPRNLSRVFARELGDSPSRAVERLRLEAAQRALAQTEDGLEQVAASCGFGSAEVLRRSFLRALRVTPSAWRARFGERAPRAEVAS